MAHVKKTQQQHHFRHNTTYKPPFSKNRRVRLFVFNFFFLIWGLICCHYIEMLNEFFFFVFPENLLDFKRLWMMDDLQNHIFCVFCIYVFCLEF